MGKVNPAIREWKAKLAASRTFANFHVFLQKAFTDRTKNNKSTVKAMDHSIAHSATDATSDKVDKAKAAALAIAKVAMIMQSNQEKQFKQMMEMFKKAMKTKNSTGAPTSTPMPTVMPKPRKVCLHCKCPHSKPDKCWEFKANKADCPANWKPVAKRRPKEQS